MYFITIVYINMYSCNVLMNVRTIFSFSYCLNGYIFSGVPLLKQFFKFILMLLLCQLKILHWWWPSSHYSWPQRVILQLWGNVSINICVSHIPASCECWVGGAMGWSLWWPLVNIEWWGYGRRSLWWPLVDIEWWGYGRRSLMASGRHWVDGAMGGGHSDGLW